MSDRVVVHPFKDSKSLTFSKDGYSKFKYGCAHESFKFGIELGKKLAEYIKNTLPEGAKIMLSGAPYNKVPVASTALANYACLHLQANCEGYEFDTFKVNRAHSYDVDYGKMTSAEREELISSDEFTLSTDIIKGGAYLIFIDDVVITGAHERNMVKMVRDLYIPAHRVTYAYYAELIDPECCPSIEAELNYAYVKEDGSNIDEFINESHEWGASLIINTRLTKFILALGEKRFWQVVQQMRGRVGLDFIQCCYANKYNENPKYTHNVSKLKEKIQVWQS